MSALKKVGFFSKANLFFLGKGGGHLLWRAESGAWVYATSYFPEAYVDQALRFWEEEREKPELKAQLQTIKKRKFLSELKLKIEDQTFRVKFYSYRRRLKSLLENFFYCSEAMRNFVLMAYLNSVGLLAPKPLALIERGFLGNVWESVLMMEDLEPTQSYQEMLKELEADPGELEKFLKEVFLSLAKFNHTGLYTLDLDKNLLIKKRNGRYLIYYFDFDNIYPFRKNNPRRAGRALFFLLRTKKLYTKLKPEQITSLIDLYLEALGKKSWKPLIWKEIKVRFSKKSKPFPWDGTPNSPKPRTHSYNDICSP